MCVRTGLLPMSKETYICQKRPTYVKRDLQGSCVHANWPPTYVKRDLHVSKETYTGLLHMSKETYMASEVSYKAPKAANVSERDPQSCKRDPQSFERDPHVPTCCWAPLINAKRDLRKFKRDAHAHLQTRPDVGSLQSRLKGRLSVCACVCAGV